MNPVIEIQHLKSIFHPIKVCCMRLMMFLFPLKKEKPWVLWENQAAENLHWDVRLFICRRVRMAKSS